jgi:hypothetical protein
MYFCFESEQSIHKIDRFHLKSAVLAADGSIIVLARGRIPNMREQVTVLLLRFEVVF